MHIWNIIFIFATDNSNSNNLNTGGNGKQRQEKMIIIRDNSTGETFTYHGANKETATSDSFCTLKPTGRRFRQNWNAVVEYYIEGPTFTQCLLRNNFEVIL